MFILIHMLPVWIYLFGALTVFLKWRNVRFMVTTHGLYVSRGVFTFDYEMKPWMDIGHINIHQGIFDRMFGVGDVIFLCAHNSYHNSSEGHNPHQNMKIITYLIFRKYSSW
ncbi:MAG: PH domain-containing protein [Acetatifactor sp.]|nr:PH domain-containing protein [Acetatifactor sp.]